MKKKRAGGLKNQKKVSGIGGWLLLYVIGLIIGELLFLYVSVMSFNAMMKYPNFIFLGLFLITLILFIITLVVLLLIFSKRKIAIKANIINIWFEAVTWLILIIFFGDFKRDMASYSISLIMAVVWTFYFLKSKRVKNTFIRK